MDGFQQQALCEKVPNTKTNQTATLSRAHTVSAKVVFEWIPIPIYFLNVKLSHTRHAI